MLGADPNLTESKATQNYAVRGEIARGGMGSILEAQDRKLGRTVAMKVMLLEYDASAQEHQRFIREASVLAQLAHPNIVPIYDMGQDEEGQWFYTMKLVKGSTLQAIINDLRDGRPETVAQFTLDRLLTIFRKVCDAMAFAHAQGIIHRDLKPANIMVGEFGEVLVMDWGLAKFIRNTAPSDTPPDILDLPEPNSPAQAVGNLTLMLKQRLGGGAGDVDPLAGNARAALHAPDEASTPDAADAAKQDGSSGEVPMGSDPTWSAGLRTMDGAVIGTPQYMSPEQAVGHIGEMDERSDQFSLGGILYAMLTLRPPVEGDTLYEVLNKVITGNITPPSIYNDPKTGTYVPAAKNGRVPEPGKVRRLPHCPGGKVPVALSAVAMKALSVAKEKRYLSVAALGEDVEAHQGGFATAAEGAGTLRQLWLLLLRHRVVSALLALIVISSACFMVALAGSARKSRADARRISEANQANLLNLHQASMADLASARQLLLRDVKAETVDEQPVGFSGRSFWHEGVALLVRSLERDSSNATAAFWLYDAIRRRGHEKRDWPLRIYDAKSAGFSPDGLRMFTIGHDKTVRVWDAASGQAIGQTIRVDYPADTATFSPDGARIITVSAKQTQVWDVASGKAIGKPIGSKVAMASFSADGTRIVTASWDMSAQVWDAASGAAIGQPMRHQGFIMSASFSPGGTRIVTSSWDKTAQVWDASTGQAISPPVHHQDNVNSANFSPDGTRIVTTSQDKTAQVWDAASGQPVGQPLHHQRSVIAASFSPDGARVVTASWDGVAQLWDASTGKAVGPPMRHQGPLSGATFNADGTRIVTASEDRSAQIWDAATGQAIGQPMRHQGKVTSAVFSANGANVVTVGDDKIAQVWDAAIGQFGGLPLPHGGSVTRASFNFDGARIVTASGDKTAQVWDAATGQPIAQPMRHQGPVTSAAFSPDGTKIVTASEDASAQVWDAASGQAIGQPMRHHGKVTAAAFSSHGGMIVTASDDKTAQIWDAATGQAVGSAMRHPDKVDAACFSPDGTRIATVCGDKAARVWDIASGQPIGEPMRHREIVMTVCFSPDGARILTASWDKTAQVWDAATGQPIGQPMRHQDFVATACFSPDGSKIVTASWDKTAQVWDAATGQPIGQPMVHENKVSSASFSHDGTRILTVSWDKNAQVWDAASAQPVGQPLRHASLASTASFNPAGDKIVTTNWGGAIVWDIPKVVDAASIARIDDAALAWARSVAGLRYEADGELKVIPAADRIELLTHSTGSGPWADLARWLAASGTQGTPDVKCGATFREIAERESAHGGNAPVASLEYALRFDPTLPLVRLMLAGALEKSDAAKAPDARDHTLPQRAAFLRNYDLHRLPDDAALWAKAATLLSDQQQGTLALSAARKAVALDPSLPAAVEVMRSLSRPR